MHKSIKFSSLFHWTLNVTLHITFHGTVKHTKRLPASAKSSEGRSVPSPPIPRRIVLRTAICFCCWRRSFSPEWSRACRLTIREAGWQNKGEEVILQRRAVPFLQIVVCTSRLRIKENNCVSSCCKRIFGYIYIYITGLIEEDINSRYFQ